MYEMMLLRAKLLVTFIKDKSQINIPICPHKKNIFIFLGSDYGNLGDVAITYAQKKYIQTIAPNANVVEIPISKTFAGIKAVRRIIKKDDIVTLIGGGNTSDMYDDIEFFRQLVIFHFRKYRIIGFPQTFSFSNTLRGKICRFIAQRVYCCANNMILMAREHNTQDLLNRYFPNVKSLLVPDVVMTLDERKHNKRSGVLLCMRSDKEKNVPSDWQRELSNKLKEKYGSVTYQDTQVSDITEQNRFERLFDIFDQFRSHELVVTDRLHGMIFCFITSTPALVIDNSNHKVSACFDWIKSCGYIKMLSSVDAIEDFTPKFCFESTSKDINERFNKLICQEFL